MWERKREGHIALESDPIYDRTDRLLFVLYVLYKVVVGHDVTSSNFLATALDMCRRRGC
jgi:hypothetical protein